MTSTGGGDVHDWGPLVGDLAKRRERALGMGGEKFVERQRSLGKLLVRERLDLLLDPGTWVEYGMLADHMDPGLGDRYLAADGSVTGVGEIEGRKVAVAAYDFTVMAGSMGAVGENKIRRLRHLALSQRIPMVWLLDSAGARIQATSGSTFAGAGDLFREQVAMSGVVPMVAAMIGHCAAGTAYIPALADFVPMVKGTSSMALGGRHLVKAAVGEDVTEEEMGGSAVHTKISGVADLEVADDEECLRVVRTYLSYFPQHNGEPPPVRATLGSRSTGGSRSSTTSCRPRRGARTTCARSIRAVVDDGDVLLDEAGLGEEHRHRAGPGRRAADRHRREPADGARRRARRERGRQGGALRLALRRVRHPARVPARRARLHRRLRGREAGDHPPRRQDAVRGERGDGAEDQRDPAQELRRRATS